MGIILAQAALLADWAERYALKGAVAALGVQHLDFTRSQLELATGRTLTGNPQPGADDELMTADELFNSLSFDRTVAVDVDLSEGASVLFDLNSATPPESLVETFDLVVNGGTLEHVFHLPNAFANLNRMLKADGAIWHIMPCHNCVDHGFYQFGPTLVFDYYRAAGFDILESAAVTVGQIGDGANAVRVFPVPEGQFGTGLLGALDRTPLLYMALVRKRANSRAEAVPTQRLYAEPGTNRFTATRWFAPVAFRHGEVCKTASLKEFRIEDFVQADGLAWHCRVAGLEGGSDHLDDPARSPLVVFENDVLLGPAHMPHDAIAKWGHGRYSHWGEWLVLSTSDGSDPRVNGRGYVAVVPEPTCW